MSNSDFSSFYIREISPFQKRFSENKKKAIQFAWRSLVITVILCVMLGVICHVAFIPVNLLYSSPCIVFVAIFCWIKVYHSKVLPRKDIFQNEVFPKLVSFVNPSMSCRPQLYMPMQTYGNSMFFQKKMPDRISGNYLVFGRNRGVEQGFSWLHTEYRTVTKVNGKMVTEWHDIFKGIFYYADFNKHFHGTVLIVPDRQSFFLGQSVGQLIQRVTWCGPGKLAVMENTEFEKLFAVYTTDQIEARYLLTPKVMQDIVLLAKNKYFDYISISFNQSKIYIAFYTRQSPFHYYNEDLTEQFTFAMCEKIRFFTSIADNFDLDVRIWTKK